MYTGRTNSITRKLYETKSAFTGITATLLVHAENPFGNREGQPNKLILSKCKLHDNEIYLPFPLMELSLTNG